MQVELDKGDDRSCGEAIQSDHCCEQKGELRIYASAQAFGLRIDAFGQAFGLLVQASLQVISALDRCLCALVNPQV